MGVALTDGPRESDVAVDVTLIDEMLRLSPLERLQQNDRVASLAVALQEAFAAGTSGCPSPER